MNEPQYTDNERSPLEVSQQFVTRLRNDLLSDENLQQNRLSIEGLHAIEISEEDSEAERHGHIVIVGERERIRLVSIALRPTELTRVYDITYLEMRDESLCQHQPTPSWVRQDTQRQYQSAVNTYVEEERDLGAEGTSSFDRFYRRFRTWYRNTTGNDPPGRSNIASVLPLETNRIATGDGTAGKQVIWEDTQ